MPETQHMKQDENPKFEQTLIKAITRVKESSDHQTTVLFTLISHLVELKILSFLGIDDLLMPCADLKAIDCPDNSKEYLNTVKQQI